MSTLLHYAWSLGFLTSFILIYIFMIRPVLHDQPGLREAYAKADGFWTKVWMTFKGWRTVIVLSLGIILTELPGILNEFQVIDWSAWLDDATAKRVSQIFLILGIVLRTVTKAPVGAKEDPEPKQPLSNEPVIEPVTEEKPK